MSTPAAPAKGIGNGSLRVASAAPKPTPPSPRSMDRPQLAPETQSCIQHLKQAVRTDSPVGLLAAASPEGIVSAVGIVYLAGCAHRPIALHLRGCCQPALDEAILESPEDEPLARRVLSGFGRSTSRQDVKRVLYACLSDSPDRAQAVLAFMRRGFELKQPLYRHRAEPAVTGAFELAYAVSHECEHARQFIRFHHLPNGVYYSRFEPNANVVPLVIGHFSQRFNTQPFLIHDPCHKVVGFWDGKTTQLVQTDEETLQLDTAPSEEDRYYHALWKRFYDSVAVDARTNHDLRRQFMPKRFWKNLSEMSPLTDPDGPIARRHQLPTIPSPQAALEAGRPERRLP